MKWAHEASQDKHDSGTAVSTMCLVAQLYLTGLCPMGIHCRIRYGSHVHGTPQTHLRTMRLINIALGCHVPTFDLRPYLT
jgi:hypothetical protein